MLFVGSREVWVALKLCLVSLLLVQGMDNHKTIAAKGLNYNVYG